MAIADDFSVAVNGDIRREVNSSTQTYTVLELHRFLQNLADDAQASGNDLVDITSDTPSERSTDNIITLNSPYNIDDTAAEYLYAGSITQAGGDTVYSGLQVLGAVNSSATQLEVVQDGAFYNTVAPFWGTQATGGLNGNAAAGILMRILVKSRDNGADINGKRVRVQARHWGDTYDFFNVTLGQGESVAAIGTTPDAQNDTDQGTVTVYTHVTNVEGFQLIDLNNGAGNREYYSQWTFGADDSGDGLKGMWEFIKDLTGNTTAKTIHGLNGEFFLGITHSFAYDAESGSGPFIEDETVVWGTLIPYGVLSSGPFLAGDYVTIGSNGAAGKVVYDNGTDTMIVALESTSIDILGDDVISEVGGAANAVVQSPGVLNNDKAGGEGILLALDDDGTTGNLYIQLVSGSAPVDNLPVRGRTSGTTANVAGAPTARTIPKIFLGSYTGSLIGAYGIGVDPDDLTSSDSLEDLSGATQQPPNNVTFTVSGLVAGEDRVLVGPRAAGILQKDQDTLTSPGLVDNVSTSVVVDTTIPTDTPSSGTVRIQDDNGVYTRQEYSSYTGNTYTLVSPFYQGSNDADAGTGNNIFISYIDKLAEAASEAVTVVYLAPRDLFVRVRDGGSTPIKTFEAPASIGEGGGSVAAIRTSDA